MKDIVANTELDKALKNTETDLGPLIATTSLWAAPEVHEYLIEESGNGAWRTNVRRACTGEKRRTYIDGVLLDDNTFANNYIKTAIGLPIKKFKGFQVCHIWPRSCYNSIYHTTIANLVLLPRALAGLTDHNDRIKSILQYRSFELYGWYPKEQIKPSKPPKYPSNWRKPFAYTERVQNSLENRSWV